MPDGRLVEQAFFLFFSVLEKLDFCAFKELKEALGAIFALTIKDLLLRQLAQYASLEVDNPSSSRAVVLCLEHHFKGAFDFLTPAEDVFFDVSDFSFRIAL